MTATYKKQSSASVDTPPTGYVRVFADSSDSLVKGKDDDGTVRPIGNEVATDLATTGDPVAVDGAGPPSAIGDILMATSTSPPEAEWQSPRGNSDFPFVDMVNVAIIDDGDSPFAAAIGTCIPVNLSGAAANVEIDLPAVQTNLNREVWVKIVSAVGSYKVTLNPAGADTIDGASSYDLDTDYERIKLRAMDLGGGTYMWAQVG